MDILTNISILLKVVVVWAAIMMVLEPTVALIIATISGLIVIAVLDLIDAFHESIECHREKNNEN